MLLKKLFNHEQLVELDNIIDNVVVLAECFIVSEVLNPSQEMIKRYEKNGSPLSLQINPPSLIDGNVVQIGKIVDRENREISTMGVYFESGKIKRYEFQLKGKLRGRKVDLLKYTTGHPERNSCTMLDISNTLKRAVKEVS